MPIAYFPSLLESEVIDVVFVKPVGGEVSLRLLVDSGFTGQSCFVLPEDRDDLALVAATSANASGALQGMQRRVVVSSRLAPLSFQVNAIAILADTAPLSLPSGIDGIAGLSYLRQFHRWGCERTDEGSWRFFLETSSP
jgi:hypothetical protein